MATSAVGPGWPDERPSSLPDATLDVRDFGAVGDGRTHDTRAIQHAIDSVHERRGGIVRSSSASSSLTRSSTYVGPTALSAYPRRDRDEGKY